MMYAFTVTGKVNEDFNSKFDKSEHARSGKR
jgi:hypothetical protein